MGQTDLHPRRCQEGPEVSGLMRNTQIHYNVCQNIDSFFNALSIYRSEFIPLRMRIQFRVSLWVRAIQIEGGRDLEHPIRGGLGDADGWKIGHELVVCA